MTKTIKFITILSTILIFTFCSKEKQNSDINNSSEQNVTAYFDNVEDILTEEEFKALSRKERGIRISEEEIYNTATQLMKILEENTTKSAPRSVVSIKPVIGTSVMTKAGGADTLAYSVSYGDGMGYALLSADRRTDEVFCLCPEGNLEFKDEDDIPPGVAMFYANLSDMYDAQIEDARKNDSARVASALAKLEEAQKSTTKAAPNTKCNIRKTSEWETFRKWGPYLNTLWGQGEPFNNNCPMLYDSQLSKNVHAVAGCVAIAAGQIMAYWKYPKNYDWNSILSQQYQLYYNEKYGHYENKYVPKSSKGKNEVAKMISDVGKSLNMNYGIDGSSARGENIPSYLKSLGYFASGEYSPYYSPKVERSLQNGCPVICLGYDIKVDYYTKWWFFPEKYRGTTYKGHAWIIDGFLCQRLETSCICIGNSGSSGSYRYLVHCNWGWGGLHDGYYSDAALNTNNGPIKNITKTDIYRQYGEEGNFQFNLNCIYNIHP